MIIRKAEEKDFLAVYLNGFDTWHDERDRETYLNESFASEKYKKGTWYVLEHDGVIKSSLISYRGEFGLPKDAIGIGSVATNPQYRKQGYATQLLREVILKITNSAKTNYIFLFSDVDPYVYQRLGFIMLPKELQKYDDTTSMLLPVEKNFLEIISENFVSPEYF